jgi:hypothetical protein
VTATARKRTHLEELVDLKLKMAVGCGFLELVAYYRQPGEHFLKWEAISRRIYDLTGHWVHRPSVTSWAAAGGIPDTSEIGRRGTVEDTLTFRRLVADQAGIAIPLEEPAPAAEG